MKIINCQKLFNQRTFMAQAIQDGEWLTTGDPLNYLTTTLKYAMDRDDLKSALKGYFKDIR